jgi:PHD/YefM family antitoxin component YafN of YafNO toxin-antitoxin module
MTREEYKHYKVRTTYIDYYVTREDVEETVLDDLDELERESMSEDELDELIEQAIETTIDELPQELELEIECEPDDLEDMICDAISSETGWFINYFEYVIIEE